MRKLAKNSLAIGTVTLIVTAGLSYAATAADDTFESYGESQFVASGGALGALVDPLGDALEADSESGTSGAVACEPADSPRCDGEAHTSSPLQALDALTGPLGDVLGGDVGPVGNYAEAGGGASRSASGAITNDGIVNVGTADDPSDLGNATFDLTGGADSPLGALSGLGNVTLDTGAVASSASLASPDAAVDRDYAIAGGTVTIEVPALATVGTVLGDELSADLPETLTINAEQVCELLTELPSTLFPGGILPFADLALCEAAVALNPLGGLTVEGLDTITAGLEAVDQEGVTFDFTTGAITIDLDDAYFAATGDRVNDLGPNTPILNTILEGLDETLALRIASVKEDLLDQLEEELTIEGTLLGIDLPPLALADVRDAGLGDLLDDVFEGLDSAILALDPVTEGLSDVVTALNPLLEVTVNVPDAYAELVATQRAEISAAAAGDISSESALRVQVGPDGAAADILLANSLVGPNEVVAAADDVDAAADADTDSDTDADTDADSDAAADADTGADSDADSDADTDSDTDSAADSDSDSGSAADADTVADSDSQADADVTTTLPSTGAPNLLPFWLLGFGLLMFGAAVLINEKRRLGQI